MEVTDKVDGVEVTVRISVSGLTYALPDSAVRFAPDGRVTVEERTGDKVRRFLASPDQVLWSGDWDGASDSEREEWLVALMRRHSDVPEEVVRSLVR